MTSRTTALGLLLAVTAAARLTAAPAVGGYPVVGTGQVQCYDTSRAITPPRPGEAYYGQDAQHPGRQPAYRDNGDGTVSDLVTGLGWVKACGEKVTRDEAYGGPAACRVGGFRDWRLPTIKELYSLILFSGQDPSGPSSAHVIPFLDTRHFEFRYGDVGAYPGRVIDAQYWSSTAYVAKTWDRKNFGVNFADGRIKGYGLVGPPGRVMRQYVRYVRGNPSYGQNLFHDNGDGTITDQATGLCWAQADSGAGMDWPAALAYAQRQNAAHYLGHDDWRLPNAKELQSLVDYTRAPDATQSAAIDPLFRCTPLTDEGGRRNYACYWTSTTHASATRGGAAAYVAFGSALGWLERPPGSGRRNLEDVHGAGAQRSDPKVGRAADYPYGRGPQGDVIRINNYVRLVRGG